MITTLKNKIDNLTWGDLINKLKYILSYMNQSFISLMERVSNLENTSATIDDVYDIINGTSVGNSFPIYADNASAIAGGLSVGKLYKTATGEIRIRY